MEQQIVVINGTGGSGKDTFVEYAKQYGKVVNFSSIDVIKKIAKLIGWNGTKTEKDRKFLSDLKKLTTEYNDLAFESIKRAVEEFRNSDNEVMFIHIREPEEIARACKTFHAKSLLIKRIGLDNITSNDSDANVDCYEYDFIIENITLDHLEQDAKNFIETLKNHHLYQK